MNKLERMTEKAKAAAKQDEPSFIRASTAELNMYIHCFETDQPMPEAGTEEFWELFDQVNTGPFPCPRELMEQYIVWDAPKIKVPPEVANDTSLKELEKYLEERGQYE